jgi:23S rRNA (uracil1939-C5)-methyltransferase
MSEALAQLQERMPFAGIVVDPPKKGLMGDAIKVAALRAKHVALVSCDPDAMARDLQAFLANDYEVRRVIPVDFFGGTPAIETVVLMAKA